MAALTTEQKARWRKSGHAAQTYIYVHKPAVIFEAEITGAPTSYSSYPIHTLKYINVSVGNESSVYPDMTARILTPEGAVRGYFRLRGQPDGYTVKVNPIAQGIAEIVDGDTLQVLDDYNIWAKLPRITIAGESGVATEAAILFKAALTGGPTYETLYTTVTYGTILQGSATNVISSMLGRIVSPAGIAKVYFTVYEQPSGGTFKLEAPTPSTFTVDSGDVIEVLDNATLDSSLTLTDAFFKDWDVEYDDQGINPLPVVIAGPDYAGLLNGAAYLDVPFDLTDSYAVKEGATIEEYQAELVDGTVVDGSIASGVFTARFPLGVRHVRFTIKDSDDNYGFAVRLVAVLDLDDDTYRPTKAALGSISMGMEGHEAQIDILEPFSALDYTLRPLVIVWQEELWGDNTWGGLAGYSGREHIKFVGWTSLLGLEISQDTDNVRLTVSNIMRRLSTLVAFGQSVSTEVAASRWDKMENLTLFRFFWYLMAWHTTVIQRCDFVRPNWASQYTHPRLEADMGDALTQMNTVVEAARAKITADYQGRIYFRRWPQIMSAAERAALPVIVDLQAADFGGESGITLERPVQDVLNWYRAYAIIEGTYDTAIASVAPGYTPAQGTGSEETTRLLVADQDELNRITGLLFQYKNGNIDRLTLNIVHPGQICDPAWQELVTVTYYEYNKRGLRYGATLFQVVQVDVEINNETGARNEKWVLEELAVGAPGHTVILPGIGDMYDFPALELPDMPTFEPIVFPASGFGLRLVEDEDWFDTEDYWTIGAKNVADNAAQIVNQIVYYITLGYNQSQTKTKIAADSAVRNLFGSNVPTDTLNALVDDLWAMSEGDRNNAANFAEKQKVFDGIKCSLDFAGTIEDWIAGAAGFIAETLPVSGASDLFIDMFSNLGAEIGSNDWKALAKGTADEETDIDYGLDYECTMPTVWDFRASSYGGVWDGTRINFPWLGYTTIEAPAQYASKGWHFGIYYIPNAPYQDEYWFYGGVAVRFQTNWDQHNPLLDWTNVYIRAMVESRTSNRYPTWTASTENRAFFQMWFTDDPDFPSGPPSAGIFEYSEPGYADIAPGTWTPWRLFGGGASWGKKYVHILATYHTYYSQIEFSQTDY